MIQCPTRGDNNNSGEYDKEPAKSARKCFTGPALAA